MQKQLQANLSSVHLTWMLDAKVTGTDNWKWVRLSTTSAGLSRPWCPAGHTISTTSAPISTTKTISTSSTTSPAAITSISSVTSTTATTETVATATSSEITTSSSTSSTIAVAMVN